MCVLKTGERTSLLLLTPAMCPLESVQCKTEKKKKVLVLAGPNVESEMVERI